MLNGTLDKLELCRAINPVKFYFLVKLFTHLGLVFEIVFMVTLLISSLILLCCVSHFELEMLLRVEVASSFVISFELISSLLSVQLFFASVLFEFSV